MKGFLTRSAVAAAAGVLLACSTAPLVASADADEAGASPNSTSLGLQPLSAPLPVATAAPGESRTFVRPDGAYQAIPEGGGRTKVFHIVERAAPWTLKPGLTVMANTYNGVVPGPVLQVNQGDTVVIDYANDGAIPDSIHLHGIHDIPVDMDGVGGISQALVPTGGHFVYRFVADTPGTFIYHTHDDEAMLDSGLYGAIVVLPAHSLALERNLAHDYLEMISSWQIQSGAENHFTLNGKEYPATRPMEVRKGERFRVRWINISGEEFHTMHTHGHYQQIVARDAEPLDYRDVEDTVLVAPGQRVDVVIHADAAPGTWLVHCHVMDHIEDATGMPAGLITAIHYAGTRETLASMYRAMTPTAGTAPHALGFWMTVLLGAIAGFTIFLGLPIARARSFSPQTIALLNALAIGILLYLVVEIAQNAIAPISQALNAWHAAAAPFPVLLVLVFVAGLAIGLVGLGSAATHFTRQAAKHAENPIVLAAIIAIGIGAHNFGEGLAIGASAASGATAVALALIVGFGLHNATEGFGVAAPLVGKVVPSWALIGLAGLIAGGPTFIGTIVGYSFYSPTLSVLFLAIAIGALVFVIGELWNVLRRSGLTASVTATMCAGFLIALATELFLDMNGG
ncbi:MAG TPA: multicopper oxidase domain-containing protein [Candidatus Cybelea sp.]|jgi:ZIP family zinc transporter|nr:multicopper oxidase domain-containing protein [Candidatus Cybelea sp.]